MGGGGGMMGGLFGPNPRPRESQMQPNPLASGADVGVEDPETTLKLRLARGEITVEEYRQILGVLRGS